MLREGTTLTAGYAALSVFCSSGTAVKYYGPVFALHHTWQGERSLINEMGCFTRGLTRSTVPIKDALNLRGTTGIIYRPGLPVPTLHPFHLSSTHLHTSHTHISLLYRYEPRANTCNLVLLLKWESCYNQSSTNHFTSWSLYPSMLSGGWY